MNEIAKYIAMDVAAISLGAAPAPTITNNTPVVATPVTPHGKFESMSYSPVRFTTESDCEIGNHSFLIDPETWKNTTICGIEVNVECGFATDCYNTTPNDKSCLSTESRRLHDPNYLNWIYNKLDIFHWQQNTGDSLPGLFYKQDLPYIVKLRKGNVESNFIALSPNESKIFFAPITKTLFTDNTSDITLVNGIISTLEETTDSEVLGLARIPADALGSYTESIGKIFSALGTNVSNEEKMVTNQTALAAALAKKQRCETAIAINPLQGVSEEARVNALTNIQNACQ